MSLMEKVLELAKTKSGTIVLAEGDDQRTIEAAHETAVRGLAKIIVLGKEDMVRKAFEDRGYPLQCDIIHPGSSRYLAEFAEAYYEKRKDKGLTREEAETAMKNELYFGAMLVEKGIADGCVAGAKNTTGDVLRAAIRIIGTKPGMKTVSSSFVMETGKDEFGTNGALVFADCAVNPNPDYQQLAEIAKASAETCQALLQDEPRVAMLSFSTKGSAEHESVEKVRTATELLQKNYPDLNVDGELQLDAAIIESIGQKKAPGSRVAGKANVLIFPDLNSGNIGYKLVERVSGAQPIGPVSQGLARPFNDLSRGCRYMDIVNSIAITVLQAKNEFVNA